MDNTITLIVSGIVMTGMVLMFAPRVLAANKGVALRNIAIWVGIFLLLALAYKTVGPGKDLTRDQESEIRAQVQESIDQIKEEKDNGIRTIK